MDAFRRITGVAASPHTGRAMRLVKVLNFVGTVRGAITTVLLAASAIGGGAVTVNQVRQERAEAPAPRPTPVRTASPTATPLTPAALASDLERRLQATLAADGQAADDLRKVAVISGTQLDQLVAETKQKLQSRYDLGLTQIATLLGTAPAPSGTPTPSSSPSVIAANALYQVIVNDLNAIVVSATRAATEPTPIPRSAVPTVVPTPAPTPVPRTPGPSPTHSASPRPSATR